MGKTRHYRPEERSIHFAKPPKEKATKYKRDIYSSEEVDDDEVDDWMDEVED